MTVSSIAYAGRTQPLNQRRNYIHPYIHSLLCLGHFVKPGCIWPSLPASITHRSRTHTAEARRHGDIGPEDSGEHDTTKLRARQGRENDNW